MIINTIKETWRIEELRKKLLITLLLLAAVRLGAAIPNPLISGDVINQFMSGNSLFSLLNIMSGGAFANMNIFALGVSPYINASIIMSLLTIAIPRLEELNEQGEAGRKDIERYTKWLALVLALIQGFGIAFSMRDYYVWNPVLCVALSTVLYTAGAAAVMWIGEQITKKGIGNGISLIIMINILSQIPSMIQAFIAYEKPLLLIPLIIILLAVIAFTVLLSLGEKRIPIQYAMRTQGRRQYGGQSTFIPIKVNMTGVIPIIFAITILSFPQMVTAFFTSNPTGTWGSILHWLSTSHPFGACLYILLIIAFTYFYASITFSPVQIADNLKKNGGFIPGMRPGKPTQDYITRSSRCIIFIGAIGLAICAAIPLILTFIFKMDGLNIGGSSMLIVVGVALETVKQMETLTVSRRYKGFLG